MGPRQVVEKTKASMKILLIFFALSVAVARRQKFCPREETLLDENGVEYGDKCVSEPKNFKCGAFFENLKDRKPKEGEVLEVQWLGAIPDALDKTNSRDIEEIFGEKITKESFGNLECKEKYTNSRCFTILKKFSSEPLDSCSKSLVNTKGTETVGDYLCKQVKRWLRKDDEFKANGKKISRLHSNTHNVVVNGLLSRMELLLFIPRSPSVASQKDYLKDVTERNTKTVQVVLNHQYLKINNELIKLRLIHCLPEGINCKDKI